MNLFKKSLKSEIHKDKKDNTNVFLISKINKINSILENLKIHMENIDVGAQNLISNKQDLINYWNKEYLTFNLYIDKMYSLIFTISKENMKLNHLILKQFRNLSLPSNYNQKRVEIKLNLINDMISSLNNYSIELSKKYINKN